MSLPTRTEVLTMDYSFNGQPAVFVEAKVLSPSTLSMDYSFNGQPFVAPNVDGRRIILFT